MKVQELLIDNYDFYKECNSLLKELNNTADGYEALDEIKRF